MVVFEEEEGQGDRAISGTAEEEGRAGSSSSADPGGRTLSPACRGTGKVMRPHAENEVDVSLGCQFFYCFTG